MVVEMPAIEIEGEDLVEKKMKIGGMTCQKCVKHVKNALEGVEGVEEALVDLESGTAIVKLSADVTDEALIAAVVEEDYEAEMA